ncbi:GTP-binding domain protein, partial [Oesophagostomum dentatum]
LFSAVSECFNRKKQERYLFQELKDIVLSKTQRKTPTVVHRQYAIGRIRAFYARKIKFLQQTLHDKLTQIINEFPKMEEVHPFYSDLMNILYDRDHYKIALGQMNTARHLIDGIAREYVRLMKYGDSLYRCKMLKRAALGRMVKLLKRQKSSFEYLEQVRQHLSRLPSIDPGTRTLILCGFPNVGKSSFINKITRADVEVQPYAFTTKALYVGHLDYKFLRWQVIDTPGILDQPLEERNTIEMQAITALAHLKAAVLFVMDISEQCDRTIEEQVALFESIRPLFGNKPVLIGLNKIDIVRRDDLPEEKIAQLMKIEKDGIPIIEMSTITQEGVMNLRDKACDELLAQRVEAKLHSKVASVQDTVLSRVFVAFPTPRDDKVRAPFIPPAVQQRKQRMQTDENKIERDENTRRLEREIELELEDDYILDLKKHYLLKNPEEKYDVIPEIWEGHNLADFVDPDIQKKLADLLAEEELREKAGEYDSDLDSDDEETKEKLELAKQIREKEKVACSRKSDKQGKSGQSSLTTECSQARKINEPFGRRNAGTWSRGMSNLLCCVFQVTTKRMKNLLGQAQKPQLGKKIKVGRSPSLAASRPAPRDELAIPNKETRAKAAKLRVNAMKRLRREARKGEADRHVYDLKPKHLFSGKRKMGKTDRR